MGKPKTGLQIVTSIPLHLDEVKLEFATRDALLTFLRKDSLNLGDLVDILIKGAEDNVGKIATLPVNLDAPLRDYEIAVACHHVVGYTVHLNSVNIGGKHFLFNLRREMEPYLKRSSTYPK